MRRATSALAMAMAAALPGAAVAGGWQIGLEAGAEVDSNVHRLDEAPGQASEAAALARLGLEIERAGSGSWGDVRGKGGALLRATGTGAEGEDLAVLAAELGWSRRVFDDVARVLARTSYYDALSLGEVAAAYAFRSLGADLGIALIDGDRRFTATVGGRDFRYRPDRDFDWRGPTLGAALTTVLHRSGDDERSLDLELAYRLEDRRYHGRAFANGCPPDTAPMPSCFVPTTLPRGDLHHQLGVAANYTGERIYSARYQLTVDDSSSYGQSVVRHRLSAAVTSGLPGRWIGTLQASAQIDQYLDGLVIPGNVASQTFTSIDEENRSSVSAHLAHPVGKDLRLEARYTFWFEPVSSDDRRFRRHLGYFGLRWAYGE